MGSRIVMSLSMILIPSLILLFGIWLRKRPPKEPNGLFGYRTRRSTRNQQTWDFAQRYIGKLWVPIGAVTLAASAAAVFVFWPKDLHTFGVAVEILCYAQLTAVVATIPVTEHALKKEFDENGRKR